MHQLRLNFNQWTQEANWEVSNNENWWRSSLVKTSGESSSNVTTFKKLHWTNHRSTRSQETRIIEGNWRSIRELVYNGSFEICSYDQREQMRMTKEVYWSRQRLVWQEWWEGEIAKFYWIIIAKFESRMIFRLLSLKA